MRALPRPDFSAAFAVMRAEVDAGRLAGVSASVQLNGETVGELCCGVADLATAQPLRHDHIHRAFSNTKLVTSALALMLVDQGRLSLDAPVKNWLPALGRLRVSRAGATTLDDTEPLARDITLRHLLSHQAGFSHGVFDPGTLLFDAYLASGVRGCETTLAEMIEAVAALPLRFQPGEGWEYSMATDVVAGLIEVATNQRFGEALQAHLLGPLGMVDTGFVLSAAQAPRLASLYVGDPLDPQKPGLRPLPDTPWPEAYRKPVPRQSGAGGLFTTQSDMLALLEALRPGSATAVLAPATQAALFTDQLPASRCVQFLHTGALPNLGFGLGGAVSRPGAGPAAALGELQWGGLAGTHWLMAPACGMAAVVMTQRFMGFWHPSWFAFKTRLYAALG